MHYTQKTNMPVVQICMAEEIIMEYNRVDRSSGY